MTTLNEAVALIAERRRRAAAAMAPAGLAVLAGRRAVRGGVRAARHRAADLPAPRRLLHQEPGVRHHARASRDRLRAARSSLREGISRTLDLVPRAWLALRPDVRPASDATPPVGRRERAGPAVCARQIQPRQVRRSRRRTAGSRRAAEARADRHAGAGQSRVRWGLVLRKALYPLAARVLRPQRRVRPERRAAAPPQDSHRQQRRRSTTTASSTRKASRTAASASATACSSAATPSCRARTATSTSPIGANIGFNCELFSASRVTHRRRAS